MTVVMYKGESSSSGKVEAILSSPKEAYTRRLLAAVPDIRVPDEQTGLSIEVQEAGSRPDPLQKGERC